MGLFDSSFLRLQDSKQVVYLMNRVCFEISTSRINPSRLAAIHVAFIDGAPRGFRRPNIVPIIKKQEFQSFSRKASPRVSILLFFTLVLISLVL